MSIAVISDIHANREALDAVMASIEKRSVDGIVCLGDIVNYGVDFDYCIETVERIAGRSILGNHDSVVIGKDPLWLMNQEARKSAQWTMERLTDEQRIYLGSLELMHKSDDVLFVHGTPGRPDQWDYVTNWFDAAGQFDNFEEHLCFVGHSHVPGIYGQQGERTLPSKGAVSVASEQKFVINVGSVGQPRDRDPRACYAIVDREDETVEIVRVPYDARETSKKILAAGVSQFNAQRILIGI